MLLILPFKFCLFISCQLNFRLFVSCRQVAVSQDELKLKPRLVDSIYRK